MAPKGILLDYGGTLVEETAFDARAGTEALLKLAAYTPPHLTLDLVLDRAQAVSKQVAERRDEFGIETPWPALTRLIYDFLGVRFERAPAELELAFWKASVTSAEMPGAREALNEFHRFGIPMGVVSNCSFGPEVIRYELEKHALADHLKFVMVSAEYAVRKPNALLFTTAAARLGVSPEEIWFVGDLPDIDVAGAKAAHMKPVWLRGKNRADCGDAYLVVDSWQDILHHFRRSTAAGA
ncbi:MAG TPA: HAD family hydrolase [Bryobacteraceae bacterium]|jgi:putative hydrolase of the HAD superfamily